MLTVNTSDPTRTKGLRKAYARQMRTRWAKIQRAIRQGVVENEALIPRTGLFGNLEAPARPTSSDPAHVLNAFMVWYRGAIDETLLEVTERRFSQIVEHKAWQRSYVLSAYKAGVRKALTSLKRNRVELKNTTVDDLVELPFHRDRIQVIVSHNLEELDGIAGVTAQRVRRRITHAFLSSESPKQSSKVLTAILRNVGMVRSNVLAQTEVIRIHAESILNVFEQFGVEKVVGVAEVIPALAINAIPKDLRRALQFTTAGDAFVCPQCAGLDGAIFTVQEARGVIPVHANCRCSWSPA